MSKAIPAPGLRPADTQALLRAVEEGDATLVESLLAAGGDACAATAGGKTLLMRAASRGYADVVKVLVDAGADVNVKKENGSTALIMAVFFGHADVVRILLEAGADPTAKTSMGRPADEWALDAGFTEIAGMLKHAGAARAEESAPGPDARTRKGRRDAPEFFPAAGAFNPVVPFSEIDQPPDVSENSPPPARLPDPEPSHAAAAAVDASDEPEEATLVTRRGLVPARQRARPAARWNEMLRSWPFALASFAVVMVAGVIADAYWQSAWRPAETWAPAEITKDAAASTGAVIEADRAAPADAAPVDETAELPPDEPVPQPDAQALPPAEKSEDFLSAEVITPGETSSKAEKPRIVERAAAAPDSAVAAESRRAPDTEPSARRGTTTAAARESRPVAPAARERNATAGTAAVRRDGAAARRTQDRPSRGRASRPADTSSPVFSPSPSARSEKKKVIPWP